MLEASGQAARTAAGKGKTDMTTRYTVIDRQEQSARTAPRPAQRRGGRRRVKKRRRPFRLLLVLLALGAVVWFAPRAVSSTLAALRWQTAGVAVQDGTVAALWRMPLTDSRVLAILDHPEQYPPALLDLLAGNRETIEFVEGYPEHHADAPAETLSEPLDTVPLLLQWDMRWGYQDYGSSMVAVSGCAPTSLAMAAAYLTGDSTVTPYRVARYAAENGYYVPGQGTSWSLLRDGAGAFGISCCQLPLDKGQLDAALDAGQPVICSMLPGDFTTEGHFIVLTGRADNGEYIVRDPNSVSRSEKTWSYDRLSGQIAALWACARA